MRRRAAEALRRRAEDARGSMTILTTGVLVVILMVIAVGTAITGVQLERNGLQHAADSAALAAAQAVDPRSVYTEGAGEVVDEGTARAAVQDHLREYPFETTRTEGIALSELSVETDGTVRVVLTAQTHPPLAGWFTRGTGTAIPLTVEGEARAR